MSRRQRHPLPAAIWTAISRLSVDAASVEVIDAMQRMGVRCILLKGPSIARHLYGDGSRGYVDTDLLVAPRALAAARSCLAGLGFRVRLDDADTPGWRQAAHHWTREGDGANVDLHRTLPGVTVAPSELWRALTDHTEPIRLGSIQVEVLSPPALAMHLALHAAQHGARVEKPLLDLERALDQLDEATWSTATVLAERLGATHAFAAGLRLRPGGQELAARLGLPRHRSVETALMAGTPPPVALGLEDLRRAKGISRLRILSRKLVPSRRFMRAWTPLAGAGRGGLLLAYLWRPVWLLARTGPGLAAWLRARRSTASDRFRVPPS